MAAICNALAMMVASVAVSIALIAIAPAKGWSGEAVHLVSGFSLLSEFWHVYDHALPLWAIPDDLGAECIPRLLAVLIAGCFGGIIGFVYTYAATPLVDMRKHHDGPQMLVGRQAQSFAAAAMTEQQRPGERPIEIAPGVPYPHLWRVVNLLVLGSIGSGKTRITLWLIQMILEKIQREPAGDHAILVHDTTGEILTGLPVSDDAFAALHPHQEGGWGWAMGRDLSTIEDIEEVADQAIEKTGDAVWGKGASQCYAGIMSTAAGEHGNAWGMTEAYEIALRDPATLKANFETYYRPAARLIEFDATTGDLSRTSMSFLLTFRASTLRMIRPLAEAWADLPPERMFSFRDWVYQDNPEQPKIVVLQRSGRHPEISAMWIGMVLDSLASHVGDPALGVSQTRTRTLAIDELPSLGRLRRLPELLDIGRNKGLNMIAAAQDLNVQFDRVYGDFSESIKLRFRLKIFCAQTPGPPTTEIAKAAIGVHRVEEINYDKTITRGPQGRTEQVAATRRIDEVPIVPERYLAHQLGVRGNRVRAILVGLPEVLQFDWPLQVWSKRR
jgi:hypothetical protein